MKTQRWEDALAVAAGQPDLEGAVHLPLARWHDRHGRLDAARQAYRFAIEPPDQHATGMNGPPIRVVFQAESHVHAEQGSRS